MRDRLALLLRLILSLSLGLAGTGLFLVQAQGTATAVLTPPRLDEFPRVSALLDVFDEQGSFVTGLEAGDITVLEDEQTLKADSLASLEVGTQFVVAVNPGPTFAIRNADGISRYDLIADTLRKWASALPASRGDDLSLVAAGGLGSTHLDASGWLGAFIAYQPASRTAVPGLDALSRAIDVAAEPSKVPGMKRAVLFITPPLEQNVLPGLDGLAARALQSNVRIFVWLVASPNAFNLTTSQAVQSIAGRTGGTFFNFSGPETLPDLESYLAPLRHVYALAYTSQLTVSGEHSLAVRVRLGEQEIESPLHLFNLTIMPPNPILVSPPVEIVRRSLTEVYDARSLVPSQQAIEILVEYTDGMPRPLARTTLYVDGQVVDQNFAEPFDRFAWNLSAYTETGEHVIQVEAEDSLGLSRISLPHRILVTVAQPPGGPLGLLSRGSLVVAGTAVLFAGGVVLLILMLGGRLRLPFRRRPGQDSIDPVTQPVTTRPAAAKKDQPARSTWLRRGRVPAAPAYLVKLTPSGEPDSSPPIPLNAREMTFGANPVQSTQVLEDPTVSALHARLQQDEHGNFFLADQGSVAGTWVNYEPLTRDGRKLEHGDLVHFGQLMFRFSMRKTSAKTTPPTDTSKQT